MSFPLFRTISIPVFACLALSLASEAAFAQQGWPFLENYGRPNYSSRALGNAAPSYPSNYAPVVAPATPGRAQIELQVPTNAKVWFNGSPTKQSGSSRIFVSSPLTKGTKYSYAVRIQWREGDRDVEQNRSIFFMAGDQVRLDFTQPSITANR